MEYYGTLGPACGEIGILREMFRAGMTGVRLNLSHGDLDQSGHWLELLSEAAGECRVKPQILMDLRGPELRLGNVEAGLAVKEGDPVLLGAGGLPVPDLFLRSVEAGDHILVDDGKLEFLAERAEDGDREDSGGHPGGGHSGSNHSGGRIFCRVLRGGAVKSGKSAAIVGKEPAMPTLTDSDYRNIRMASRYGVTGVMLPFVRNREDLLTLREALHEAGAGHVEIFAKIENTQGVRALDELLPYCDQVVIARGDLGNAMPLWELPAVQKEIAGKCRRAGKPFMVVTQMLDSMHERAVPTRAEVLDIFNAALDGASSLMLTGETAAGKYPAEAMKYLVNTGAEAIKYMEKEVSAQ